MFVPLLVLIVLASSQEIYASPPPPEDITVDPSQPAQGQQQEVIIRSKHAHGTLAPEITLISLKETILFPKELTTQEPGCFGDQTLKISQGQMLTIRANQPFIAFFKTQTALQYYNFEEYYGNSRNNIIVNYLIESNESSEGLFSAIIPLDLKCPYITNPYLKMIGKVHVDFYQQGQEKAHSFNFILVCASEQTIQDFVAVYQPGYIFFWVYCNLVLQIYNAYHRDRTHLAMFLVFFGSSIAIHNQLYAYVISVSLFLLVLLRERRQGQLNVKAFSLYLTFFMLAMILIVFTYSAKEDGSDWNSLWIALQNFIQVHITMFMILRLLKLNRLRTVFWYFVGVSLFAVVYGDNKNIFFSLNFRNPLDLSCLKASLFFPLMMLPISSYFTSLTGWMHRVIGAGLTLSALLPLKWGIATMAVVIVCVEAYEIMTKSIEVIKHTY